MSPPKTDGDPPPSKKGKASAEPNKGLVIELCAGSAMLSRCFSEYGFEVLAIDHAANRFHPHAKVCNLSLTEAHTWDYLRWVCCQFRVVYIHAAPPCGTCSRAREQPEGPPPLRNDEWVWGFPDLNENDRARVDAANAIYAGLATFIRFCEDRSIAWCVENPADSLLWQLPPFKSLRQFGHLVKFQACMFGGSRPTWKGFLTTVGDMRAMAVSCNGGHEHKPYGRVRLPDGRMHYATSEEAAYPRPLCLQVVRHVCNMLSVPFIANPDFESSSAAVAVAASAHKLPRGRKVPPVVPEFKHIITVTVPVLPQVNDKRCLVASLDNIPQGSKLLSHGPRKGEQEDSTCVHCTFGVYFPQDEFLARAKDCAHPSDSTSAIPDDVKKSLFETLTKGPAWIAEHRVKKLRLWNEWMLELKDREAAFHDSLDSGVRRVLKGKRVLLLQRIAEDLGWPDRTLFDELRDGFVLVGCQPPSGVFDTELKPAISSVEHFSQSMKFMRPALIGKVKAGHDDANSQALWDATMKEVEGGLLDGPHPL